MAQQQLQQQQQQQVALEATIPSATPSSYGASTPATEVESATDGGPGLTKFDTTGQAEKEIKLQYLIQQSSIYVSLLSAKMKQQQEQMRQNKEKRERRALDNRAVPNNTNNNGSNNNSNSNNNGSNNSNNNNKGDDSATRRSTRGAVASSANASRPAKVTKKRRAKAAKKTATTISDYFKKAELEALPAAAEVEEEPFDENSKLGEHKNLRSARQPSLITGGVMKDYQLEGLEWLVSLYENGLNGILADEMGLGKTLQTISFLAFLREKSVWGPFLVVGPVSVLSSWVDEIARWAPDMPALLYHGTPAERAELRRTAMAKLGPGFPIICTNYEMIMNDKQFLAKYSWKFVIIDEGHRLKNMNCKLVRELKSYTSANRLLLTGTPLQNNLAELWSLLNFLLPEIFDDYQYFEEYFDFSKIQGNDKASHVAFLAKEEQKNLVGSLHALLKPFLLRRVKTDVETSLPPKKEYILYAPLSQNQKDLYGALLDHEASEWLHEQVRLRYPSSPDRSGGSLPKKRKLLAEHNDDDDGNVVTSKKPRTPEPDSESARSRRIERKEVDSYRELSDDEYFGKLEEEELMDLDPAAAAAKELSDYEKSIMQGFKQISNKKLQNLYMQLRQACNSPQMFYWPWAEEKGERPDETIITDSGKMMLLERLVPALIERGHKILIFSQFKKMLDIIEDWAEHLHGWEVCRLDGGVSQEVRREQIRKFNNEQEARIFLLTTRAGGLGINLTSSDTVIIFDSDWNPQMDLQAQDRAHRIGQTKPVVIYRFATENTVEQNLLDKAEGKRRLEKLIIQKGKFKSLSGPAGRDEDLDAILLKEDFEKVNVVEQGQQVLTDEELEALLDRSPEAFAKKSVDAAAHGKAAVKIV